MIDVYEPIEEGLDIVTSRRHVSCMTITLSNTLIKDTQVTSTTTPIKSTNPDSSVSSIIMALDTNHFGYQPPLPSSELHPGDYHTQSQQWSAKKTFIIAAFQKWKANG